MNFTKNQQHCIEITNRNLIVSAGAGAGKTMTLVERIFHLLSTRPNPCSLDELLIVTFSRMAAAEMKERLAKRLRKELADLSIDDNTRFHLEDQLFHLPRAQISTIHSFCLSVINSYPEAVGMAPGFELMSEEEARLFRKDFFKDKLEELLKTPGETRDILKRLLEEMDPVSGISSLLDQLLAIQDFVQSLPYREKFVNLSEELTLTGEDGNILSGSHLEKLLYLYLNDQLQKLLLSFSTLCQFQRDDLLGKFQTQYDFAVTAHSTIESAVKSGMVCHSIDAILENIAFPRLAGGKAELSETDERFKAHRERIKKRVDKLAKNLALFTPENIREDIRSSNNILHFILHEIGLRWTEELFKLHVKNRRLTFGHLEHLALKALRTSDGKPTEIAHLYQNQFRHLLVDEFQDTNEIQDLIIRAIARPTTDLKGGNLFVVGDVKQSIYEFRQADPTLFLKTYDHSQSYQPGIPAHNDCRVDLAENFRSSPKLLEEFNNIFRLVLQKETIGLDYTKGHEFIPGRLEDDKKRRPTELAVRLLPRQPNPDQEDEDDLSLEANYVADLIAKMGEPWKDICILLRSTVGSAAELLEALNRRNIPTFCDSRIGFLTSVEVIEFQAILKTVYNPYDDVSLLGTLRGPAARWNEEELIALRHISQKSSFYANLRHVIGQADHPLYTKANEFFTTLSNWQLLSQRHSMADFFTMIFDDLHLIEQAAVRPGGDQRKLNLLFMLDKARQFDSFMTKGLGSFLAFLDDLIANDEDIAPPAPLPDNANMVRIMSVHKSKGMQFPVVICPFLGRKFNDMSLSRPFLSDREWGIVTKHRDKKTVGEEDNPPLYEMLRHVRRKKQRSEELRLFYVALTRAEEAVWMIGSSDQALEKLTEASNSGQKPSSLEVLDAQCPLDWVYHYLGCIYQDPTQAERTLLIKDVSSFKLFLTAEDIAAFEQKKTKVITEETKEDPPSIDPFIAASKRLEIIEKQPLEAKVRAKVSVTEAKRAYESIRDSETPPMPPPRFSPMKEIQWQSPALLGHEKIESPGALRGQATHRFLALCDLIKLSRGECKLSEELTRLVEKNLLTTQQAGLIDLHQIAWFLNGELGARMRQTHESLFREKPFTVKLNTNEVSPEAPTNDLIILQGVVDLLFKEDGKWILVDYKTDYCGEANSRLAHLIESYTPQMQLYQLAVERALGEPISECWLVFLQGQTLIKIKPETAINVSWEKIIEASAVIHSEPTKTTRSAAQV